MRGDIYRIRPKKISFNAVFHTFNMNTAFHVDAWKQK